MTSYEHPHFKKMVRVWKTKSLFFLFKIWPTNRFLMAKSYNFNFRKNDVTWPLCANGLFSIFDNLGGWQPWLKWVHIAPIKGVNLFTNTCMQPEKEKTEFLMQEETSFYSPAKNHRQFDKSLLSPSSRENAVLQKCNSMAMSWLLPRCVQGFGGRGFNWLVHLTFGYRNTQKMSVFANCPSVHCKPFKNVMYVCLI